MGRRPLLVGQAPLVVPDGERRTDWRVGEELLEFGIRVADQRPAAVAGQLSACPLPLGAVGQWLVEAVEPQMPEVVAVHQRLGPVVQPALDQCVAFGNLVASDRDPGLQLHVAAGVGRLDDVALGGVPIVRRRREELEVQGFGDGIVGTAGEDCRNQGESGCERAATP